MADGEAPGGAADVVDGPTFLGEHRHTLDDKGRLILPSAFREPFAQGLVITVGMDYCLALHPSAHWPRVLEGVRSLRTTDRRERMFARTLTAYAHPQEPDRQGRIAVPPRLREYAGLRREVAVVGADARVELWDAERWDAYREEAIRDFASTEQPFDLGMF